MKANYGWATELRKFLDPSCLNRLVGRHYLQWSQNKSLLEPFLRTMAVKGPSKFLQMAHHFAFDDQTQDGESASSSSFSHAAEPKPEPILTMFKN